MAKTKEEIQWRKVKRPRSWHPEAGEELTGYYCGRTLRDGQWGQYEVITVMATDGKVYMLSGTQIVQLADVAMLKSGSPVRVVFIGMKQLSGNRQMKQFEMYVTDADLPLEVESVPLETEDPGDIFANVPRLGSDVLVCPLLQCHADVEGNCGYEQCPLVKKQLDELTKELFA